MGFEQAFFIAGWAIYNNSIKVLQETGMIYLPLLIIWYQGYYKLLDDDNFNNIVILSEKNIRYKLITFVLLYQLAFVPFFSIENISPQSTQTSNKETIYNKNIVDKIDIIHNKATTNEVKIPIIWGSLHLTIKTLTDKLISVVPISSHALRTEILKTIDQSKIDGTLAGGLYAGFYKACYVKARNKIDSLIQKNAVNTSNNWFTNLVSFGVGKDEYDWAGGSFYLDNKTGKGFYLHCPKTDTSCHDGDTKDAYGIVIPYKDTIKQGTETITITKHRFCGEFWENTVRPSLLEEMDIETGSRLLDDKILRKKLIISNFDPLAETDDNYVTQGGSWFSLNALQNLLHYVTLTILGWLVKTIVGFVNFFLVVALPLFQSMLLFLFIVLLPFLIILSALRIDVLIGAMMFYFAVVMLSVIWHIIHFIDKTLIDIIYNTNVDNDGLSELATNIVSNLSFTSVVIDIMIAMSYVFATYFWFSILKAAGADMMDMAKDGMGQLNSGTGGAMKETANKIKPF